MRHLALFLCLAAACTTTNGEGGGDDLASPRDLRGADLRRTDDGGGGDDLAGGCGGLGACDCTGARGCQRITEPCFCPYPQCGSGACLCGGGSFLGCAPESSGCEATVTCRPAGRVAAVGDKGCLACGYASDCATAFRQMMDKLKATPGCGISDAQVGAFTCSRSSACVTSCINAVERCEDIGCGLCPTCRCPAPGSFERCVAACG